MDTKTEAPPTGEDGSAVLELSTDDGRETPLLLTPELERAGRAAARQLQMLRMPILELTSRLAGVPYRSARRPVYRSVRIVSRRGPSRRPSGRRTRRTVAARRARSSPHHLDEPDPGASREHLAPAAPLLVGGWPRCS